MSLRAPARLSLLTLVTLTLLGCPGGGAAAPKKSGKTAVTKSATKTPAGKVAIPEPEPFDRATAKTPWTKAKVGQYAVYTMAQMGGKKMRFEVTKVEDSSVTFKIVRPDGSESEEVVDLAQKEEKFELATEMDGVLKDKLETKTIKVGERDLEVQIVKREYAGNSSENWITSGLPPFVDVGGSATAKSYKDGAVTFELVEFGGGE